MKILSTMCILSCLLLLADINETEPNNSINDSGTLTVGLNNTLKGNATNGICCTDFWLLSAGTSGTMYIAFNESASGSLEITCQSNSNDYGDGDYQYHFSLYDGQSTQLSLDPNRYYLFRTQLAPSPELIIEKSNNLINEYSIILSDSPLPVELIDFKGAVDNKIINLKWRTASELNNSGFEIQKSNNGRDWQIIDFIEGKGTTNEINEYRHQDTNPFLGINYYRLKQIDYDGAFEYSKVIAIESNNLEDNIQVYPNPSNRNINIHVGNPLSQRMKIKVIDNLGMKVWESELIEGESNWRKEMEIEGNGIYFITAQIGGEIYYERVVIMEEK